MAYTQVGIVNIALSLLGAKKITLITDSLEQAVLANTIWDHIRDEVTQVRDWRFARTKAVLGRYSLTPLFAYDYAYVLPSDFLRLAKPTPRDPVIYPEVYSETVYPHIIEYVYITKDITAITKANPGAVTATAHGFSTNDVIEINGVEGMVEVNGNTYTITSTGANSFTIGINTSAYTTYVGGGKAWKPGTGKLCLLTDFQDEPSADLYLYASYIRKVTDWTLYPVHFVTPFAYRLAAEMSIRLTEGRGKFDDMIKLYNMALVYSDGIDKSLDYLEDEQGSTDWEEAGR